MDSTDIHEVTETLHASCVAAHGATLQVDYDLQCFEHSIYLDMPNTISSLELLWDFYAGITSPEAAHARCDSAHSVKQRLGTHRTMAFSDIALLLRDTGVVPVLLTLPQVKLIVADVVREEWPMHLLRSDKHALPVLRLGCAPELLAKLAITAFGAPQTIEMLRGLGVPAISECETDAAAVSTALAIFMGMTSPAQVKAMLARQGNATTEQLKTRLRSIMGEIAWPSVRWPPAEAMGMPGDTMDSARPSTSPMCSQQSRTLSQARPGSAFASTRAGSAGRLPKPQLSVSGVARRQQNALHMVRATGIDRRTSVDTKMRAWVGSSARWPTSVLQRLEGKWPGLAGNVGKDGADLPAQDRRFAAQRLALALESSRELLVPPLAGGFTGMLRSEELCGAALTAPSGPFVGLEPPHREARYRVDLVRARLTGVTRSALPPVLLAWCPGTSAQDIAHPKPAAPGQDSASEHQHVALVSSRTQLAARRKAAQLLRPTRPGIQFDAVTSTVRGLSSLTQSLANVRGYDWNSEGNDSNPFILEAHVQLATALGSVPLHCVHDMYCTAAADVFSGLSYETRRTSPTARHSPGRGSRVPDPPNVEPVWIPLRSNQHMRAQEVVAIAGVPQLIPRAAITAWLGHTDLFAEMFSDTQSRGWRPALPMAIAAGDLVAGACHRFRIVLTNTSPSITVAPRVQLRGLKYVELEYSPRALAPGMQCALQLRIGARGSAAVNPVPVPVQGAVTIELVEAHAGEGSRATSRATSRAPSRPSSATARTGARAATMQASVNAAKLALFTMQQHTASQRRASVVDRPSSALRCRPSSSSKLSASLMSGRSHSTGLEVSMLPDTGSTWERSTDALDASSQMFTEQGSQVHNGPRMVTVARLAVPIRFRIVQARANKAASIPPGVSRLEAEALTSMAAMPVHMAVEQLPASLSPPFSHKPLASTKPRPKPPLAMTALRHRIAQSPVARELRQRARMMA